MEEPLHRRRPRRWPVGIVTPRLSSHDEERHRGVQNAGLLALEELIEPPQLEVVDGARSAAFAGHARRRPWHVRPGPDHEFLPRARRVRTALSPHPNEIL